MRHLTGSDVGMMGERRTENLPFMDFFAFLVAALGVVFATVG